MPNDRIAELRALRQAERSAFGGNDLMPWASAADVLRGALYDDCDALLDCAEALQVVLEILPVCPQDTGIVGIEARYNFAVVGAREALARLNGDSNAG